MLVLLIPYVLINKFLVYIFNIRRYRTLSRIDAKIRRALSAIILYWALLQWELAPNQILLRLFIIEVLNWISVQDVLLLYDINLRSFQFSRSHMVNILIDNAFLLPSIHLWSLIKEYLFVLLKLLLLLLFYLVIHLFYFFVQQSAIALRIIADWIYPLLWQWGEILVYVCLKYWLLRNYFRLVVKLILQIFHGKDFRRINFFNLIAYLFINILNEVLILLVKNLFNGILIFWFHIKLLLDHLIVF